MKKVAAAVLLFGALSFGGSPETVECLITLPADGGVGMTRGRYPAPELSPDGGLYLSDGGAAVVSCKTDAGTPTTCGACAWAKGANLLMQCSSDVYVNQDGGAASSSDFSVDFTNNKDPYIIYLLPGQSNVSVQLVTGAEGKTCKFAPTLRTKPK